MKLVARDLAPAGDGGGGDRRASLAALDMNTVRGTMKIVAVKAPFYGERDGKEHVSKILATVDRSRVHFARFSTVRTARYSTRSILVSVGR